MAAGTEAGSWGGRALALFPVGVAALFAVLMLPRAAPPDDVPLPLADGQALARQERADDELARQAMREGLPGEARLLGTAIRELHALEPKETDAVAVQKARTALDDALAQAVHTIGINGLLELRAVELQSFLTAVDSFERKGEESDELVALAGSFVRRMRAEGWCDGHTLSMTHRELRVMFKLMWDAMLSLEGRPELAPTLDELRSLYAFFLSHPHPTDASRAALEAARAAAKDKAACDAIATGTRNSSEAWRLERINRLAAIDPSYPAAYARGVILYRRGSYGAAAEAFRDWLRDHPSGPWSLRARNHLRAAAEADQK
jgi:hypothetical protein